MATIYIVDKETKEVIETYENVRPEDYDLLSKTLRLQSGRGVGSIQYGDDVIMKELTDEESVEFFSNKEEIKEEIVTNRRRRRIVSE